MDNEIPFSELSGSLAEEMGGGEPGTPEAVAAVRPAQFSQIGERQEHDASLDNLDIILDVPLRMSVELGRTTMTIGEIVALSPGSVIELDKLAGEPVDVVVNERLIAKGEVVVVDENFGVRLTDIVGPAKRATSLS